MTGSLSLCPLAFGGRGKFSEVDTESYAIHTLREWRRRKERGGVAWVHAQVIRSADKFQYEKKNTMRIAHWGSESARCGHCTLCGEDAIRNAKLAFLLPVAYSESTERVRVDWNSDILAAVCKQCYERYKKKARTKRKILDVTCPECGAPPGELCVLHPVPGYGWRKSAHSNRWLALRSIDQEFNLRLESAWKVRVRIPAPLGGNQK